VAGQQKVVEGTYSALDAIGHGPARVTEEVWPRMPTEPEAAVLGLGMDTPVQVIERTTWDAAGRVVEYQLLVAAGDRNAFAYEIDPGPEEAGLA
jgi:DNA-binding GntR family transcriptional regulator